MARDDLPHIPFYIGDWRRDIGVQSLSFHYRGIWFELVVLMHCSEQRGKLVLGDRPMSDESISRMLGLSHGEWVKARLVLLKAGVPSVDEKGALYCRRMVRDEEIRRKRAEAGQKGGLSKTQANGQAKAKQNPDNDIGNDSVSLSDEDWIKELRSESHYSHIRVRDEYGKMKRWCEVNKREPTRRRFINWLNRIERPMQPGERRPKTELIKLQPGGWLAWLESNYPDAKSKDYWKAPGDVQREFNELNGNTL